MLDIKRNFVYNTDVNEKTFKDGGEIMKLNTTKIALILADREMTRAALAEACGISRQNVSTIMTRGTCEPKTVGKLAKGLGVDASELIKED